LNVEQLDNKLISTDLDPIVSVKDRALQVQGTLQEDEEKGPMMGE
jgi:hypothetical protein